MQSYLFNMLSERASQRDSHRLARCLDVFSPVFSLVSLVAVTIYVFYDASQQLRHPPADDDVNVTVMWIFSSVNLVVDIVNIIFFIRKSNGPNHGAVAPVAKYRPVASGDDEEEEEQHALMAHGSDEDDSDEDDGGNLLEAWEFDAQSTGGTSATVSRC